MKILCTGGAGYVGSTCLRWLTRRGHDVTALDNLSAGNAQAVPAGRLIEADIEDRQRLTDLFGSHRFDAVMHFAAVASVPESISRPELYYRTNVVGTKNVLDAMVATGVSRIVFSSTAATYAFDSEMPLTEESGQRPRVPYGTTKLAAENMIREYATAYGLGYSLLRYFNASGADADGTHGEDRKTESHLIPLVLSVATGRRDRVHVYGGDWPTPDGTCIRDYVHVEDLADAHQRCVETLEPGAAQVYNLGSGTGVSVLEVIAACEAAVGGPLDHEIVARRPGDPAILVASPARIEDELGWTPRYQSIREIVETAWRWHRGHPHGYAGPIS